MAIAPVSAPSSAGAAFGLDFQSLLKIILTQLTYQDPLKPLDNFQFVSQLAQFSQLQQTQSLSDQVSSLLAAQSATQATGLLGRTVDIATETQTITGTVKAISFTNGQPELTINTQDGRVISNLSITNVAQVR
jgi:flagellar basal-body rod modification protein FlgD